MSVHIIVDSASDLDTARAADYGIRVVPLVVTFGDEDLFDGVDIDNAGFYQRLQESTISPRTSAPNNTAFTEAYLQAVQDGATGILSLHVSKLLSGTYNSACLGADVARQQTDVPIEVLDTLSVTGGYCLPAMLAAQKARQGASLEELKAFVNAFVQRSSLFFVVDTLTYLQRGGRIGRASAVLGSALDIKPILRISNGEIVPFERVRTRKKALARLIELVKEAGDLEYISLIASDKAQRSEFLGVLRGIYSGPVEEFELGAAVGTHAGPGAVAVALTPRI